MVFSIYPIFRWYPLNENWWCCVYLELYIHLFRNRFALRSLSLYLTSISLFIALNSPRSHCRNLTFYSDYTLSIFSSLPCVTSNWIDTENPPVSCIIHPNHIKMLPYHFTIVYSSIIHLLHPVTLIKLLICFYLLLIRGGFENFYTRVHHTKMRV